MAGPSARRVAGLSDFDGTITRTDVAEAILARFAPPGGWGIEGRPRAPELGCIRCGTCKLRRLFELRVAGHRVVYIGDGDSDLCPAVEADVVFAKERLADLCDSESIPYHRFETFADIEREMRTWRGTSSASSGT